MTFRRFIRRNSTEKTENNTENNKSNVANVNEKNNVVNEDEKEKAIANTLRKINLALLAREEVEEKGQTKSIWRTNTDILLDIKYLLVESVEIQEKILKQQEEILKLLNNTFTKWNDQFYRSFVTIELISTNLKELVGLFKDDSNK